MQNFNSKEPIPLNYCLADFSDGGASEGPYETNCRLDVKEGVLVTFYCQACLTLLVFVLAIICNKWRAKSQRKRDYSEDAH